MPGPMPPSRPNGDPQVMRITQQQNGQIAAAVLMSARLPPPGGMIGPLAPGMPLLGDPPPPPATQQPPEKPLAAQQRQMQDQRRLPQQQADADEAGDAPIDGEPPLPRAGGSSGAGLLIELRRLDNAPSTVRELLLGAGNSSLWPGADGITDFSPD